MKLIAVKKTNKHYGQSSTICGGKKLFTITSKVQSIFVITCIIIQHQTLRYKVVIIPKSTNVIST